MYPRIYQAGHYQLFDQVTLDERATHHVRNVLRKKIGDQLIVFGHGEIEWIAEIITITKKSVVAQLNTSYPVQRESPLHICLAHALCAGEKMDWVIQKSVELGVKTIVPLLSERSVACAATHAVKKQHHWEGVVQHAVEQCGRTQLPVLQPIQPFQEYIETLSDQSAWILDPYTQGQTANTAFAGTSPQRVTVLIGPEGGWSDTERSLAAAARVRSLRLGPRILRTETAAVVILSILQMCWGDF